MNDNKSKLKMTTLSSDEKETTTVESSTNNSHYVAKKVPVVWGTYYPNCGHAVTPLWIHDWSKARLPKPQYTPSWVETFSGNGQNMSRRGPGFTVIASTGEPISVGSQFGYIKAPNYFDTVQKPTNTALTPTYLDRTYTEPASEKPNPISSAEERTNVKRKITAVSTSISGTSAKRTRTENIRVNSSGSTVSTPMSIYWAEKYGTANKGVPSTSTTASTSNNSTKTN